MLPVVVLASKREQKLQEKELAAKLKPSWVLSPVPVANQKQEPSLLVVPAALATATAMVVAVEIVATNAPVQPANAIQKTVMATEVVEANAAKTVHVQ